MSTIAIIGGHGQIGLLTARDLAEAGNAVRSVIRNPDHSADVSATGATPVVLDIESASPGELAEAISPADVIIFAAGAGPDSGPARKETVDHQGAVTALAAAADLGARFIVVSYLGADEPATGEESWVAFQRAKKAADDAVRAASIDWTIVRPGSLNNEPTLGLVTIDDALTEGTTSRANVATLLALLATTQPGARPRAQRHRRRHADRRGTRTLTRWRNWRSGLAASRLRRATKVAQVSKTGFDLFTDRNVVAMRVNGELKDLAATTTDTDTVEAVTIDSPDGLNVLRHSAAARRRAGVAVDQPRGEARHRSAGDRWFLLRL